MELLQGKISYKISWHLFLLNKANSFTYIPRESGKLKGMMPAIISIAERLRRKMSIAVQENKSIEIKDLAVRYRFLILNHTFYGYLITPKYQSNLYSTKFFEQSNRKTICSQVLFRCCWYGCFWIGCEYTGKSKRSIPRNGKTGKQ